MAAEETTPAPANNNKSMMGKVIIGFVISIVVLVESVVAYMMLPNPELIANKVREEVKQEIRENSDAADDIISIEDQTVYVEVELGAFNLGVHQPSANTTLNITCSVMGTIAEADQAEFDELLANNQNRLRERIIIEFRSAKVTELTDAGLGLIKRRILEKSNTLLGKPILKEIMFPEYNYYQQ